METTKDGKKVNILCITDRNHERSVVALHILCSAISKMKREYLSTEKEITVRI